MTLRASLRIAFSAMRRRYQTLLGTAIAVDEHGGDGPPVVLVHGLGGSAGNWSLTAPQLAMKRTVVALDLAGHGRSGPLPRHDLDAHVQTVIGLIEVYGFSSITLVGNSMGGLVSKMVASRRPDLVDGLVLLAPATPPPTVVVPSSPAVAARLAIQSLPGLGPLATASITARWSPRRQVSETLRIVMADPSRLPTDYFERAVELTRLRRTMPWASRAFAESVASIRRVLMRRSEYLDILDRIEAPTTLIFGSEDRVVAPVALRWLAARETSWRSIELPDTGHTPMLERPDLVVREIDRLFEATLAS